MNMNNLEKQLLSDFEQKCPGAKVLAFFVAGSHFFDLNGPNSDKDYRAIYMPSAKQLNDEKRLAKLWAEHKRLNKVRNSQVDYQPWEKQVNLNTKQVQNQKNNKDDVDCTFYSLDEYLRLLCKWDFNMLELLYAPNDKIIIMTDEFREIMARRDMFFPFDLYSYLGFIDSELTNLGVDSSSYDKYAQFAHFLRGLPASDTLSSHWPALVDWHQKTKIGSLTSTLIQKQGKAIPTFKITQMFQGTDKVKTILDRCEAKLSNFGHRQKSQAENGVEWKGLHHALRLLYEAEDLMKYRELRLPFSQERHDNLMKIKKGEATQAEAVELINSHLDEIRQYDDAKRRELTDLTERKQALHSWGEHYFHTKKMQLILKDMTV